MSRIPLFQYLPQIEASTPVRKMISEPTPLAPLSSIGKAVGHAHLYVKREDKTHNLYGGNKVRNLEFIFGEGDSQKVGRYLTLAPKGSNFIAALSAHAARFSLPISVEHFVPAKSAQINAHWLFSQRYGVTAIPFPGRLGTIPAAISMLGQFVFYEFHGVKTRWISPGGSNVTGALGHVNAALEFAQQIKSGEIPTPDALVVGAGTGGTIAGLMVGLRLAGLRTQVFGVRCVDPMYCNRFRIASLANRLAQRLGLEFKIHPREITLVNSPRHVGYGMESPALEHLREMFFSSEKIVLDSTYTLKVADFLISSLKADNFRQKKVVYWHTFSPKAMEFAASQALSFEPATTLRNCPGTAPC